MCLSSSQRLLSDTTPVPFDRADNIGFKPLELVRERVAVLKPKSTRVAHRDIHNRPACDHHVLGLEMADHLAGLGEVSVELLEFVGLERAKPG